MKKMDFQQFLENCSPEDKAGDWDFAVLVDGNWIRCHGSGEYCELTNPREVIEQNVYLSTDIFDRDQKRFHWGLIPYEEIKAVRLV